MKIKLGYVVVKIPDTEWPSMVIAISGENCPVEIADDGNRVVQMLPEDARILIGTPMSGNMPWRAANVTLLQQLGPPPKPSPGINIASVLGAQRAAAPRHPLDIGGQVHDTLRAMGRWPQ